jgi:hypothetical protein
MHQHACSDHELARWCPWLTLPWAGLTCGYRVASQPTTPLIMRCLGGCVNRVLTSFSRQLARSWGPVLFVWPDMGSVTLTWY